MFIWLKTMRLSITNNTAAEDSAAGKEEVRRGYERLSYRYFCVLTKDKIICLYIL